MKGIIFNLLEDFLKERLGNERFEELIEGVAGHYRSPIRCRQSRCMLEGGPSCEFELEFAPVEVVVP